MASDPINLTELFPALEGLSFADVEKSPLIAEILNIAQNIEDVKSAYISGSVKRGTSLKIMSDIDIHVLLSKAIPDADIQLTSTDKYKMIMEAEDVWEEICSMIESVLNERNIKSKRRRTSVGLILEQHIIDIVYVSKDDTQEFLGADIGSMRKFNLIVALDRENGNVLGYADTDAKSVIYAKDDEIRTKLMKELDVNYIAIFDVEIVPIFTMPKDSKWQENLRFVDDRYIGYENYILFDSTTFEHPVLMTSENTFHDRTFAEAKEKADFDLLLLCRTMKLIMKIAATKVDELFPDKGFGMETLIVEYVLGGRYERCKKDLKSLIRCTVEQITLERYLHREIKIGELECESVEISDKYNTLKIDTDGNMMLNGNNFDIDILSVQYSGLTLNAIESIILPGFESVNEMAENPRTKFEEAWAKSKPLLEKMHFLLRKKMHPLVDLQMFYGKHGPLRDEDLPGKVSELSDVDPWSDILNDIDYAIQLEEDGKIESAIAIWTDLCSIPHMTYEEFKENLDRSDVSLTELIQRENIMDSERQALRI